ncbi:cellulose biosynthesis protein BcsD [Cupriavidus plantarum]|uniref:cellulose biosynthesis protein BcsD n=1 Tax=Cupriavidus plantarum TaxID=942865 RepID=UPI000EB22372|nr:cellulose biosynthesis protein BcsD [Cupriavidus plantarum]RLK44706.1 cellulose synthase subunit D [Cupriavidus plantarum]
MNEAALQYLTERHCSTQWRDFLGVLGEELVGQLNEAGAREFMARMGARFAQRFDLGPCNSLAELERAIAQIWLDVDWGWTGIEDNGDALVIRHHCAPLRTAFGESSDAWSGAFLQGAYQHWFRMLGSSDTLQVSQQSDVDATGSVEFRFGR